MAMDIYILTAANRYRMEEDKVVLPFLKTFRRIKTPKELRLFSAGEF